MGGLGGISIEDTEDEDLDEELAGGVLELLLRELELLLGAALELDDAVAGLYEHQADGFGAPGKLAVEQAKLPVRTTVGANTPDLPSVVWWVPLMLQVPPGWAHLTQPEGASAAACAPPTSAQANTPAISLRII
jgi:hypothetical protein